MGRDGILEINSAILPDGARHIDIGAVRSPIHLLHFILVQLRVFFEQRRGRRDNIGGSCRILGDRTPIGGGIELPGQ